MKSKLVLCVILSAFAITPPSYAQKYKTIEKSGRRYHWLKWSGGKIYKAENKAERNESLNNNEEVLYFVVKAEEIFYYKDNTGEYGYKITDIQDELDFNVSKTIAGIILTNFDNSISRGTSIGEGARRTEIHQSLGTLKKNVTISGITPIKEHWEKVVYKNQKDKTVMIKMARVYSMNKSYLEEVLQKASKHVGLTKDEANAARKEMFDSIEYGDIDSQTDEEFDW